MATAGSTQTSDNRVYLFRLQILIIDGGLLVLRNFLDQSLTAQGLTLSVCLNQEKATITRLRKRGVITQVQYDQLFPTVGQVPTTSDMDITLIICLLRCLKCPGLNKKFDWNASPVSTDVTVEADICRLKAFRNKISHISKTTVVQPNDFVTWWNDIEQILVRLSSPALNIQQKIDDFKVCTIDPEEEKRIQEEIKKWKDYEAEVDQLKEEVTDIKVRVTEVEKNLEEIKRRQPNEEKSNADVSSMQTEEEKYQKRKKDLQSDLIKFYRKRCSSLPLSPFFEEVETHIAGFYVIPDLVAVKQKSLNCYEEERTLIKSLKDLFATGSGDQQEIYLSAESGLGKTAFSKYLAITWCLMMKTTCILKTTS